MGPVVFFDPTNKGVYLITARYRPFATSTLLANSSSCAGKAKVRSPNSHSMGMVYLPTKSNIHLRQIFRVNMPVLWSIWDSYTSWALMICLSGSILGTILYIEWLESGCLAFQDFRPLPPPKIKKTSSKLKKQVCSFFSSTWCLKKSTHSSRCVCSHFLSQKQLDENSILSWGQVKETCICKPRKSKSTITLGRN